MHRPSFPTGQVTAQKIKALYLTLAERKGEPAARAFREELRLTENDLEDETRLYPLPVLHRAIKLYEKSLGDDALAAAADKLLSAGCIGAWSRIIRTTTSPGEALQSLDGTESEYGRTTRWETVTSTSTEWSGKVHIAHDPAMESDGRLQRYRAAELAVVPALFGFSAAHVTAEKKDGAQLFHVRWLPKPTPLNKLTGSSRWFVLTLLPGILAWLVGAALQSVPIMLAAVIVLILGAMLGRKTIARFSARNVAEKAQAVRLRALERSLALRELRDDQGPLEGSVIAAQYRLVTRMGSGASGVIFEATRIGDDLPVAIKLLRAAAAHDVTASDRLRREAEALGLAWHPNVVELHDHGHLADGTSYLVMELLRGDSLATRIRDKGLMTPEELLPMAIDIADALSAIHAAGVVHRDIKPSNVFVVLSDDGSEKVKILDFGIARVEWEEMRITGTGVPLGTPGYMSPEQESGAHVDGRSDLYSLGALMYECLFGEPPPKDESRRFRVSDVDRESGVHRSVTLSPEWRALLDRALAKDLDKRFPDARAMLSALKVIAGAPVSEATLGGA